jgi:hypothetical protein
MIATTPSGTRTLWMRRPLGRTQPSVTSPTGSGRPATSRRPVAMASIRASLSRRRSTTVSDTPAAVSRETSAALALSRSSVRSTRRSAAAASAASLAAVAVVASTRPATWARRPSSGMVDIGPCYDHAPSRNATARAKTRPATIAIRNTVT